MLNALTVDVEDYFQVSAFAEVVSPDAWDGYDARVGHRAGSPRLNATINTAPRRQTR